MLQRFETYNASPNPQKILQIETVKIVRFASILISCSKRCVMHHLHKLLSIENN